MTIRTHLAAIVAAAMLLGGGSAALAQPTAGSTLTGTISTSLDSQSSYVGEDVALTNVSSSDGSVRDGTLMGTVTSVQKAGQGKPGKIGMHFRYLRLSNGRTYDVNGEVVSTQAKTKNNTLKEAGGALAGMLVGNALGKTLLGASGGGVIGAVGGFLVAHNNREPLTIPSGSSVTVRVVSARRQA